MFKKEYINVANILTFSRIILGLIFFVLFFFVIRYNTNTTIVLVLNIISEIVFIIAIITDGLDGYFARKNKIVTDFGKHFDPLADSIFFIIVFFSFYFIKIMPLYFFIIILFRECFMHIFLRPFLKKKGYSLPANIYGKMKTLFQSIFSLIILSGIIFYNIFELLLNNAKFLYIYKYVFDIVSYIFFLLIALLSVISLIIYIIQMRDKLK